MKLLFWTAGFAIFYTYAGYPAWLWLRSRMRPRPIQRAAVCPSISVVMVVRNEAARLRRKLENLRALDYPSDRIEFIVLSDGSNDRTAEILHSHTQMERRLRVLVSPESRGKAAGLNDCLSGATGEIVLFTDVRQMIEPGALRLLVENFADPDVGCASGELMLGDPAAGESIRGTGLYWTIEKRIRQWESASGSVVGATGAIYAARRALLVQIPSGTLLDDVYLPMNIARRGFRVIFDDRARAWDTPDLGGPREFSRKVRTLTGNYQLLQLAPWLLSGSNPIRYELVSHKLMRLAMPLVLVIFFVASALSGGILFRVFLVLQAGFYLLGFVRLAGVGGGRAFGRLADASRTFLMLNGAAFLAFLNWLRGRSRSAEWTPSPAAISAALKTGEIR